MFRVVGLFLVVSSHFVSAGQTMYLCKDNEILVFGCELDGQMASLCASKDFSNDSGYLQYRFGSTEKIEFMYPEKVSSPKEIFFLSSNGYAGGGSNVIRFNHNGDEYWLFDAMIRTNFTPGEPHYPEFTAGVVVRNSDKTKSVSLCENNDASIRSFAFEVLERENLDHSPIL